MVKNSPYVLHFVIYKNVETEMEYMEGQTKINKRELIRKPWMAFSNKRTSQISVYMFRVSRQLWEYSCVSDITV